MPPKKFTLVNKRAGHWDNHETEILLLKCSEESIQQRLRSCTRKRKTWEEKAIFLNAAGYLNRNADMWRTRINTLLTAYRNYMIAKRKT